VVFDQAPLLVFFLVGLALCTYIATETGSVTKMRPVENLIKVKNESASGARAIDGTF
jgi:hypothetical protein